MAKRRWIKVYHDMLGWEWYNTPGMLDLWIRLLLNADENGVVMISVNSFAQECGVTRQRLRTMLGNLVLTKQITKSATKCPTKSATKLIICNYESYQGFAPSKQPSSQPSNQPSSQPSFNQVDGTIPFSSSLQKSKHKEREEKKETISKEIVKKESSQSSLLSLENSIEKRQKAFYDSLRPFQDIAGGRYSAETLRSFYDYWSEPNKSRTKMRWEMETTWDLSRRIARWANHEPMRGGRSDKASKVEQALHELKRSGVDITKPTTFL